MHWICKKKIIAVFVNDGLHLNWTWYLVSSLWSGQNMTYIHIGHTSSFVPKFTEVRKEDKFVCPHCLELWKKRIQCTFDSNNFVGVYFGERKTLLSTCFHYENFYLGWSLAYSIVCCDWLKIALNDQQWRISKYFWAYLFYWMFHCFTVTNAR